MKFYYRYKLILKNIAPLASSIKEKLLLKLVNEYKWKLSCIYLLIKVEVLLHRNIFPLTNYRSFCVPARKFAWLRFRICNFSLKLYRLDRYVAIRQMECKKHDDSLPKKNTTIINSS